MKKCSIICNRHGGHGIEDETLNKIIDILEDYNYIAKIIFTTCPGDATNIIQKLDHQDLVLSIGGDGTFSEVIAGNIKRKVPLLLGHLPNGTTNDVARIYGMDKTILQNLKNILDGKVIEIDVPTINDKSFIYVCGFGKFLNIPYETPQDLKKKFGHLAYLISGFKDFFKHLKSYNVKYTINNKTYKGKYTIFIVSNSTSVAGFRNFYKRVDLNDGKVEVAMIYAKNRTELLNCMAQLVIGGAENVKGSTKYITDKIEIEFDDIIEKKWDVDGEKFNLESKTYIIEVKHKINLLVPKK